MENKWVLANLLGRLILINVVPFFLVFHLVMQRRRAENDSASQVKLIAGELKIVGIFGYFIILSIYFFSIPVLEYMNVGSGYNIRYVQPDPYTVYLIATVSFYLVCSGIYLRVYKYWAFRLAILLIILLLFYAFSSILHYGLISLVPVILFAYFLYRLTREELVTELQNNQT
ncbi:MAG: hypothetical protein AB7S78_07235 [Candidatus Omnitrophota bacterium]